MIFLKLTQNSTVEFQGKYGRESETVYDSVFKTVYDSVFIAPDHIESMTPAGLTYLRMVSGERISVRETPEEIIAMLTEGASK